MRACPSFFDRVIEVVENPHEDIKKHGGDLIHMQVVFGDEEIKQFEKWLNERRTTIYGISEKRYSFGSLALAFLLGWWIGDD